MNYVVVYAYYKDVGKDRKYIQKLQVEKDLVWLETYFPMEIRN